MLNVDEVNKTIKRLELKTVRILDEMKLRPEDSRELFFEGLKATLDHMFLHTTTPLYYMIENHSITVSYVWFREGVESGELNFGKTPEIAQNKLIDSPKSIEDYAHNLAIAKKVCAELKEAMNYMNKGPVAFYDKEYFDIRKSYSNFLNQIESFIGFAIFLKEQGEKGDEKFLKLLVNTLETMKSLLAEASKHVEGGWGNYGEKYSHCFNQAKEFFDGSADALVKTSKNILAEDRKTRKESEETEEKTKTEEKKPVQPALSLVERRRLEIINTANDLYDEFVNGTIVDLKNQTPYSVRKEYFEIIQMFEDFCKKFKMPLSESTGFNKAEKAKMQLEKLFEKVSQISQNATTTNIYMMKE